MESNTVLPKDDHIRLILEGEGHLIPCETCKVSEVDIKLPLWYDEKKYKRGQKYIRDNINGQIVLTLAGMIAVLAIPSMLVIFLKTHRSSTPKGAYRRYASTMMHINTWYNEELKPGTTPWKSLTTVRQRHIRSSNTSVRRGDGPLSQRDLAIAQFAFVGIGVLRPHLLGMDHSNRKDLEGYIHFWRTIGHMIGIEDRFNVCRESFDETIDVFNAICNEVYQPCMRNPPEYFNHMVSALITGMKCLNPVLSEGYFHYFSYRVLGVPGFHLTEAERQKELSIQNEAERRKTYKLTKNFFEENRDKTMKYESKPVTGTDFYERLGRFNRCMLFVLKFLLEVVAVTWLGRIYVNFGTRWKFFTAKYFPYSAMMAFGIKESFVNMFAEDKRYETVPRTNKEMMRLSKY